MFLFYFSSAAGVVFFDSHSKVFVWKLLSFTSLYIYSLFIGHLLVLSLFSQLFLLHSLEGWGDVRRGSLMPLLLFRALLCADDFPVTLHEESRTGLGCRFVRSV